MTRASLREYAAVQRERYRHAARAEKRQLLDEVVAVAGIHRKAAIRLLRRAPRPRATPGPGGRPLDPEELAAAGQPDSRERARRHPAADGAGADRQVARRLAQRQEPRQRTGLPSQ